MLWWGMSRREKAEWASMLGPGLAELSTSSGAARAAGRRVRSRVQVWSKDGDRADFFERVREIAIAQGAPRLDKLLDRCLDEAADAEDEALEHEEADPEGTERRLTEIDVKYEADQEAAYATVTEAERAAIVAGELEGIRTLVERKMVSSEEARLAIQSARDRWVR